MPRYSFRQHCEITVPFDVRLYQRLAEEWVLLNHAPHVRRQLRRWQVHEPALAGCVTPGDILDRIDNSDYEIKDLILAALVRIHTEQGKESEVAGLIVLQALLPALSSSQFRTDQTDWRELTIATFWEVLGEYPLARRPRKIAANLVLDTRKRCRKEAFDQPAMPLLDEYSLLADNYADSDYIDDTGEAAVANVEATISADMDLESLLRTGVQRACITQEEANLLRDVYLHRSGPTPATVRKRCQRIRERLSAMVRDDVFGPTNSPRKALG